MSSLGDRREEVHDQRCKVAIAEPNLRHVERHVAQSRRQKLGRGYITNQSQLLQLFRKTEKARNTKDGNASPRRHSKNSTTRMSRCDKGNEGFLAPGICISNTYCHIREHKIIKNSPYALNNGQAEIKATQFALQHLYSICVYM